MNSYALSSNLTSRPKDEHFASIQDFLDSAKESKATSVEANVPNKEISFVSEGGKLGVKLFDTIVAPTRFCMEKITTDLGLPLGLLGRLTTKTYCIGLNELWEKMSSQTSKSLIQVTQQKGGVLRDLTSIDYSRVWDADYYSQVLEFLPNGFEPAIPSINSDGNGLNINGNRKPALFRGDRDSIAFWQTENDNGGTSDFGGLRMGFMTWNSEVKSRSLGYQTFIFRGMCANFIIWDMSKVRTKRKYHRGVEKSFTEYYKELQVYLMKLDNTLNPDILNIFGKAAKTPFVGNGKLTEENKKQAEEKLKKEFWTTLGKKDAADIMVDVMLPQNAAQTDDPALSYLTVSNAVSWFAKKTIHADGMEQGSKIAGQILTSV